MNGTRFREIRNPLIFGALTFGLPVPVGAQEANPQGEHVGFAVPLKFRSRSGVLSFISIGKPLVK